MGGIIRKAESDSETGYFIVGSEEPFFVVWQGVREFLTGKRNSDRKDNGHSGSGSCTWVLSVILAATVMATMLY